MRSQSLPEKHNVKLILAGYIIGIFVIISVLAIFVPLNPHMPAPGLDPSWQLSMNEAIAHHLSMGKDIIFTFGPYASIYTQAYHPETDFLMLLGSLFIGLFYAVALLYLANNSKTILLLAMIIFLDGFMYLRDPLLFSYPLIIAACAPILLTRLNQRETADNNILLLMIVALVISPLGLLPLIKGSLLLICGITSLAVFFYFLYHRYRYLAAITLVSPVISSVAFWTLSGQSLSDLPGFFAGMAPVISGYTESMSLQGNTREIIIYLISSAVIVWSLVGSDKLTIPTRVFLAICFSLFLFIAFKSGFVRHDGHAMIAGTSLVVAALVASLIHIDKRIMIALLIALAAWFSINKHYASISAEGFVTNVQNTYARAWRGGQSRLSDSESLGAQFENSLSRIRQEYPIPELQGSTDIYSFDQSYLLASSNEWNPRPVFQSYQAYTQSLAEINEAHLRGDNAPENILFRVQPIDGRMPTLEDGISWPALFDNYKIDKLDDELAYLSQKQTIQSRSAFDVIYEGRQLTGEHVMLPMTSDPVYAEIDLEPTLLGKLLGLVFKPPQLRLTLKLKDGTIKDYRVISRMMKSGFFISPLVQNTKDFVFLLSGNQRYLANSMVEDIVISPVYGGSIFWSASYTLKLKAYRGEAASSPLEIFNDDMMGSISLAEIFNASMTDSIPEGYTQSESVNCDGSIDVVNGWNPAPSTIKVANVLSVSGWLAVSTKDGVVPDDVFVTLKKTGEAIKYVNTQRTPRNDVKVYFKQPEMPDPGYSTTVDVTTLNGRYELGLSRGYKGKMEQCQLFKTLIIGTVD